MVDKISHLTFWYQLAPCAPCQWVLVELCYDFFSPYPKTVLLSPDAERSNILLHWSHLHNISQQLLEIFDRGLTPFSFSHLGCKFFILYSFGHLLRDLKGWSKIQTTEFHHLTKKLRVWLFEVKYCDLQTLMCTEITRGNCVQRRPPEIQIISKRHPIIFISNKKLPFQVIPI